MTCLVKSKKIIDRNINQHTGIGIMLMKFVCIEKKESCGNAYKKTILLPGPEHPAYG